jgi:predicted MFS family arabinose efflux permease
MDSRVIHPDAGDMAVARRVVVTMAFAVGAVVANLYYAQPLEATLATAFHTSSGAIGLVITVLQIGYALGLATVVPLGDLLERRRLLITLLSVCVLGLVGMALAPSYAVLCSAAVVVGLTTVTAQVIVPFAAHLAEEGQRGRVVGTVMSGLLIGILVSRTVSGLVAQVATWRAVFGFAAVLTALVAVLLWRELPRMAPTVRMAYPKLLGSVLRLVREEPLLRLRMLYGAVSFAAFSVFWTSSGFLLAGAPYHWNEAEIGLIALVGAAGAVAARFAGRLSDAGHAHRATAGFILATALSWVALVVGGHSVIALVIGVALLDLGVQGTHILNQSLVYALRPDARSRLNTAYMTAYFVAGAVGSALSAAVYSAAGWTGVCVLGAVFPVLGCLLWVAEAVLSRRRATVTDSAVRP